MTPQPKHAERRRACLRALHTVLQLFFPRVHNFVFRAELGVRCSSQYFSTGAPLCGWLLWQQPSKPTLGAVQCCQPPPTFGRRIPTALIVAKGSLTPTRPTISDGCRAPWGSTLLRCCTAVYIRTRCEALPRHCWRLAADSGSALISAAPFGGPEVSAAALLGHLT